MISRSLISLMTLSSFKKIITLYPTLINLHNPMHGQFRRQLDQTKPPGRGRTSMTKWICPGFITQSSPFHHHLNHGYHHYSQPITIVTTTMIIITTMTIMLLPSCYFYHCHYFTVKLNMIKCLIYFIYLQFIIFFKN